MAMSRIFTFVFSRRSEYFRRRAPCGREDDVDSEKTAGGVASGKSESEAVIATKGAGGAGGPL
jgi:hypothetical protein